MERYQRGLTTWHYIMYFTQFNNIALFLQPAAPNALLFEAFVAANNRFELGSVFPLLLTLFLFFLLVENHIVLQGTENDYHDVSEYVQHLLSLSLSLSLCVCVWHFLLAFC
jgi:hypothetical protein